MVEVVKGPSLSTPDDSYSFESRRLTYVTRAVRCEQCPYDYSIYPYSADCMSLLITAATPLLLWDDSSFAMKLMNSAAESGDG